MESDLINHTSLQKKDEREAEVRFVYHELADTKSCYH